MNQASYVFVDDDQHIGREVTVTASSEKEARKLAWSSLTDEEKDACGNLDCVDVIEIR